MSDTEICNLALIMIGEDTILNLAASSKQAVTCNRLYPFCRDEVLGEHPWAFGKKQAVLAPSSVAPLFGYAYACPLPADYIGFVKTEDDLPHKVVGNDLHCDDTAPRIEYIYQVIDTTMYPKLFVRALAARIAMELAIALVNDQDLHDRMEKKYDKRLSAARFGSSTQNTAEEIGADNWLQVRI